MKKTKKKALRHTLLGLCIVIVLGLIGVRLYLPYWLTDYVNRQIAQLDGYGGSVRDIDVSLWRGAYQIHGLNIHKDRGGIKEPFVAAKTVDLSIEWRALWHGEIVAEIVINTIDLNFAKAQTGEGADWENFVDSLSPFKINRLDVQGGKVAYIDHNAKPEVNIYIDTISATVTNLRNVEDRNAALPSDIQISGRSIGNGTLRLMGKTNILRDIPDFDLDMKLENAALAAINDYTRAAAAVDFVEGKVGIYSELAAAKGKVAGYVKLLVEDIKVVDVEKQDHNPLNVLWESLVAVFMQLFKNHPKDQFALRIPIEGDLSNPDKDGWAAFLSIFENAFGKAFSRDTEGRIDFKDALQESQDQSGGP
jgi:hypothetical protein